MWPQRQGLGARIGLFARAAGVGGASTLAAAGAANTTTGGSRVVIKQHALDDAEFFQPSHAEARAQYRAWREGSPVLQARRGQHQAELPSAQKKYHYGFAAPRTGKAGWPRLLLEPPPSCRADAPSTRLQSDYSHFELVGRGGFGSVYAATSAVDGRRYALKVVAKPPDDFLPLAEASCLASVPAHENLVRYMGSWSEPLTPSRLRSALVASGLDEQHENDEDGDESALDETDDDSDDDATADGDGAEMNGRCLPPYLVIEANEARRAQLCSSSALAAVGVSARHDPQQPPSGSIVLAMEYVDSPSLAMVLASEMAAAHTQITGQQRPAATEPRPLPPTPDSAPTHAPTTPLAVRWRWIAGIANGLSHMHRHGWMHNDVKPANVLVCSPDGAVKLCDFGLSCPVVAILPDEAATSATAPPPSAPATATAAWIPSTAGTSLYMAPERGGGYGADHGADHGNTAGIEGPATTDDHAQTSDGQEEEQVRSGASAAVLAPSLASPSSDVFSLGVLTAEVHGGFKTAMERGVVLGALKHDAAAASDDSSRTATPATTTPDDAFVEAGRAPARLATEGAEPLVRQMLMRRACKRPTAAQIEASASEFAREAM